MPAALHTIRVALAVWTIGLTVSACKASAAPPTPKPTEYAAPAAASHVQAAPATPPREQQFELPDDEVDDPAEALHALRHNCCDEAPAAEVDAVVRKSAADTAAPPTPPRKAPAR